MTSHSSPPLKQEGIPPPGEAVELTVLGRLHDEAEAAAGLQLRDSDWSRDVAEGKSSIMLAGDNDTACALSVRARLDRIAASNVDSDGVRLHDGTTAGVGDTIVTRENSRRLATAGGPDFVTNGDLWTVTGIKGEGSLLVSRMRTLTRRSSGCGSAPGLPGSV